MADLRSRLSELSTPIAAGIVGAGSMGHGLLYQITLTPGMRCVALADIDVQRAIDCAEAVGEPFEVTETPEQIGRAMERNVLAVCADGGLIASAPGVDVVVEASNAIGPAGRAAESALLQGKHLVLMNAEIDLIFGPYLTSLADASGVVYTSCDGDQHGVIKRLWDEAALWGIEPMLAGNIKGFLDRQANPTDIVAEADKRQLDYRMATAFTDGTKLNIEMALVANALDLGIDVPGMLGPPAAHVGEALKLFDLERYADGGGVVDYLLGAEPGGSVFVVGRCDEPYQRRMLTYYKMGDGPFYLFYRPYHLCHIEATRSIAEAFLDGISLLRPSRPLRTNVYAYAKRALAENETLDGVGGYTCYGMIEDAWIPSRNPGLPVCLADSARLRRPIAKGEKILLGDVCLPADGDAWRMYERAWGSGEAGRE